MYRTSISLNIFIESSFKMQQLRMQAQEDWKFRLKKQIYQENLSNMPTKFMRGTNKNHQKLADSIHGYQLAKDQRCVQSGDHPLDSYSQHPNLSFYIPIRQQVYIPTEIERVFGKSIGNQSKKVEQIMKIFKTQGDQTDFADKWRSILRKYICPLDVLQKMDLYVDLLKNGTLKIQKLLFTKYADLKPMVFFKQIVSVGRYFQSKSQPKSQLNVDPKQLIQHYCKYCNLYNCLVHVPLDSNFKQVDCNKPFKESKRFYQTSDYSVGSLIQLLYELRQQYLKKSDSKAKSRQACSKQCYRNLNFKQIQGRYKEFWAGKDTYDYPKLKSLTKIFGYQPCLIAKAALKDCHKVLVALLFESHNSLINSGGVNQCDYLRRKSKFLQLGAGCGCSCKQGECTSKKCQCLANKRGCSPQRCLCSPMISSFFSSQLCINQNLTSKPCPPIKVGISSRNNKHRLGLFTMTAIKQGEVVFWVSGQHIVQNSWNDLDEFLLNKSGERSCNLIFGNTNGKSLGGKYRFICHSNTKDANLRQIVKWVDSLEYTVFLAAKTIEADEELVISCICGSIL